MGMIHPIIETARREVSGRNYQEIRAGEEHQVSGALALPPGFDGQPLPGDLAVADTTTEQGEPVFTGTIDLKNAGKAGPGEGRIYARGSNGVLICEVWAKEDGTVQINPGPGMKLQVGEGARKPVALDGDGVTIGTPGPPTALPWWAWVAAVNTICVPLSGGAMPPTPPTEITGATVQASSTNLEAE